MCLENALPAVGRQRLLAKSSCHVDPGIITKMLKVPAVEVVRLGLQRHVICRKKGAHAALCQSHRARHMYVHVCFVLIPAPMARKSDGNAIRQPK